MNDSKDFQDAESVRSGNSHVTSRPVSFPPHPIPEGMLRHSFVSPRRKEGPPSIWDTHGISGNVFANPPASSSAPCPQELNQWNSSIEEPLHTSTVEKSARPEQNEDLKSAVVVGLPHNSLKSLLHWRWLNLWLTVQTGISDLDFVLVSHFSTVDEWSGSSIDEFHWCNS